MPFSSATTPATTVGPPWDVPSSCDGAPAAASVALAGAAFVSSVIWSSSLRPAAVPRIDSPAIGRARTARGGDRAAGVPHPSAPKTRSSVHDEAGGSLCCAPTLRDDGEYRRRTRMSRLIGFYATQFRVLWEWRGGPIALVKRLIVTLVVATISFLLTAFIMPRLTVDGVAGAAIAVILISLFNALIRPVALALAAPVSLILVAVLVLVLQIVAFLV